MSQTTNYEKLIDSVMSIDEHIRFVGVSDLDGNLEATGKREGVETLLSLEDTQDTLKHAANAWKSRMKHYDKIGQGLYTLAVYEKLRRATIPLEDGRLLLVTIDNQGGQKQILDRILNLVRYKDYTNPNY